MAGSTAINIYSASRQVEESAGLESESHSATLSQHTNANTLQRRQRLLPLYGAVRLLLLTSPLPETLTPSYPDQAADMFQLRDNGDIRFISSLLVMTVNKWLLLMQSHYMLFYYYLNRDEELCSRSGVSWSLPADRCYQRR